MRKCRVRGCDKKRWARGLCPKHLWRQKRGQPLTGKIKKAPYTPEEDALLLSANIVPWHKGQQEESELKAVAKKLGRSYQSCRTRLCDIRKGPRPDEGLWSAAEDEYIRQRIGYPRTPPNTWPAVAAELGRTYSAVLCRAHYLRKEMEAAA